MLGLSDAISKFMQICGTPVTKAMTIRSFPQKGRNHKRRDSNGGKAASIKLCALVVSAVFSCGCSQSRVAPVEDRVNNPTPSSLVQSMDQPHGLNPRHKKAAADDSPALGRSCSVELYGDSILHGGYLGDRRLVEPPAAALQRMRPRYHVIDRTVNGETASARSGSFENEARIGRIVIIEHGLNDSLQNLPLETALRSMVVSAKAEGRHVILTGLSQTLGGADIRARGDAIVRRVAADLSVPFADWGSVPLRVGEMADVIHPAQPYSTRLVERLIQVLDSLSPECA